MKFFEEFEGEYLKFDRVENKLSQRPDVHAFIMLDQMFPETKPRDLISGANHDEFYLRIDADDLFEKATKEQLIDLHRCGLLYNAEEDYLYFFA